MAFTRGTTPTHIFATSLSLVGATALYITYKQQNRTVLEKTIDDVEISEADTGGKLTATLSQADTLLFAATVPVKIQIRAKFPDGSAVASQVITTTAKAILKDGEI